MRLSTPVLLAVCLATTLAPSGQAQTRLLVGQITDDGSKQGIPGATISVINGTQTVRANPDGRYRLTIPSSPLRLQVRVIGYAEREIAVDATQTTLGVAMTQEAVGLTEVVVTGSGTTQARHNVATAVSMVSGTAVSRAPSGSLESALQGKVVGAMINMNSGAPGGGGQIQIRGVTSILGNAEPLIVVDGVPFSNAAFSAGIEAVKRAGNGTLTAAATTQDNSVNRLADLNTEDIESIQILKSAAASAIYGSRATNGVVLITTKRGRGRATQFHLRQRVGANTADRLLGSRHFMQATLTDVIGATMAKQYCPTDPCPYYDYQGKLYGQRDLAYETALSLGGGTDVTTYFVSANDKNEPGTMLTTGARHLNLRLNLDQAIGSRWTTSMSAAIYRSDAARGISNNDNTYTTPMDAFAYTPAVVDLQALGANGQPIDNVILRKKLGNSGANPFQTIAGVKSSEDVWRQTAGAQVRYNAWSSVNQTLNFSVAGGFDRFDADGQTYSPNYLEFEADDGFSGTAAQTQALVSQYTGSLNAVYIYMPAGRRRLSGINSLTTSAGLQYSDLASNRFSIVARGLLPGVENIDQGTPTLNQLKSVVRNEAVYASEELLGLSDKFSASARVRAERASVNGNPDKWFYWPAASAAYRFVDLVPHANEIKLRASLGVSGNQPLYGIRDNVLIANGIYDGRNAIAQPTPIGNSAIEPERMRESEIGVDGSFFGNRVGLEASYFNRTITNLLLQAPLAPTSGAGSRYINGGTLRTAGVELALNALPIHTADFSWSSRAQYYSFQSRVVSLPPDVADFPLPMSGNVGIGRGRIAQGYRSTLIWGNTLLADGSFTETMLADANPKFQMAFGNDFTSHGFTLNTLFDWRNGGYVADFTNALFDDGGNSWDYDKPSPNPAVGKTLGAYRANTWNQGKNADAYLQDGSYLKLREVTITYSIPARYAQRVLPGSHDARVSFSGRNLFTWTRYWNSDPEVSNYGNQPVIRSSDLLPFPPARSFLFGVDIGY